MYLCIWLETATSLTVNKKKIWGVCVRVCALVLFNSVRDAVIYHWQGISRLVRVYVCVFCQKGRESLTIRCVHYIVTLELERPSLVLMTLVSQIPYCRCHMCTAANSPLTRYALAKPSYYLAICITISVFNPAKVSFGIDMPGLYTSPKKTWNLMVNVNFIITIF